MSDNIVYMASESHAVITINRPELRNAMDIATIKELSSALQRAEENPVIRSVIITGSGNKVFAAGADIKEFLNLSPLDLLDFAQKGQDLLLQIESMKKPVVAAINGHAFGLGCELAMACTLRVITEKARIGLPELALGIVPGNGGTQRLARLVGMGRALEMILLGDLLDSDTALQYGLVNRVVPEEKLMETCEELCNKMADKSPIAIRLALKAVREGIDMPLEKGLKHEVCLAALGIAGGDHKEGIAAFLEKRKPKFDS